MNDETLRFTQGDKAKGSEMTNFHFKVIATQPPSRIMTEYYKRVQATFPTFMIK